MVGSRVLRRTTLLFLGGVLLAIGGLTLSGSQSGAVIICTKTWDGGAATTNYDDGNNWNPNGVPGSGQVICSSPGDIIELSSSRAVSQADLDGTFTIQAGGILQVNSTAEVSQIDDLTITGGGILRGNADIDLLGAAVFGDVNGNAIITGTGTKTLASGATATIGNQFNVGLNATQGVFVNDGTISYNASILYLGNNSTFTNNGTFDATFAGWYIEDDFSTTAPRWTNGASGIFNANATGDFWLLNANDGTFNANSGSTCLCAENQSTNDDNGTYDIDTGATLRTNGGYITPEGRTFGAGAQVNGQGTFRIEAPGATWDATDSVENLIVDGAHLSGTSSSLGVDDTLVVTVNTVDVYGTLAMSTAAGSTTDLQGTIGVGETGAFVNNGSLSNSTSTVAFRVDDAATVENSATGTMTFSYFGGGTILSYCSGPSCTPSVEGLTNAGTIHTDAFPGFAWTVDAVGFDNDGTFVVDSGDAYLHGPNAGTNDGDDDGSYQTTQVTDGIFLTNGYTRTFDSAASVTGPGTLVVNSGTAVWGSATPISNLHAVGGSITGSPTITGSLLLNGGNFNGSGTTTLDTGATATVSSGGFSVSGSHEFVNKGTFAWANAGANLSDTAILRNEGTMNVTAGGYSVCSCAGTPVFENASGATMNITVPANTFYLSADTTNDGTITVSSGTLAMTAGNSSAHTGAFDAVGAGVVDFGAIQSFNGATLGGSGLKRLTGTFTGTPTVTAGTLGVNASTITGGTTTIGAAAKLVQTGGFGIDNGTVSNSGTWEWFLGDIYMYNAGQIDNGGTWNVKNPGYSIYDGGSWSGDIHNLSTGTINKSTAFQVNWNGQPVINDGLISVTGGDLRLHNFANYDSGTFTLSGGTYRMTNGRITAGGAINNLDARVELLPGGVWRDEADSLDVIDTLSAITSDGGLVADQGGLGFGPIDDQGLIEVRNSNAVTVDTLTTYSSTVTRVRDSGSTLQITNGPTTNNGTVTGSGSVAGVDVTNNGSLTPGNSPGILSIGGDVTMSGTSATNIEINGATVGTGYDRLAATGAVTVDGTLNISGTLQPTTGTFTIVTGSSVTGTFDTVTGYNIGNGYYYTVVYNAASVDLVVAPLPTLSITDVTEDEGNAGTTTYTFDVTLSSAFPEDVTVEWDTADDTATVAGNDYVADSDSVTFTAGETLKQVTVEVNGDLLNEADERFFVDLSNPVNATIADSQGDGNVDNDDALPNLSIDDVTQDEGDAGTTPYNFTVSLDAPSGRTVTVDWDTADNTATAASGDYVSGSNPLTFLPGETSKPVTVNANGDLLNEGDDVFDVVLSNEVNAAVSDGSGAGTLTNDDALPTVAVDDVTQAEGNFGATNYTFTVSLNTASGRNVTVDWNANNGSATAGSDYVDGGATLTFLPGETSKPVTVQVVGDLANEANESFTVDLTNLVNVDPNDVSGLGTINNDDGVPSVSISDITELEGTGGVHSMSFDVTLSNPSGSTVMVDFVSVDGTATTPSDYAAVGGVLSFLPGETVRNVQVPIVRDDVLELDESFSVVLSNPVDATLGDDTGTGTLTNDDETILVDDTADAVDASPGNGVCATAGAVCSLRAAVQESNARAGTQIIVLGTGATYNLTLAGASEDAAATGDLDVTASVVFTGQFATVDANDLDRVFQVSGSAVADMSNFTITDGSASTGVTVGGGVFTSGTSTLNLSSMTVSGNTAGSNGGGVAAFGSGGVTFTNSTISTNTAVNGAGVFVNGASTVTGSTFSNNIASTGGGGGLFNGSATISGSNFTGNQATSAGGGLSHVTGTLTMSSSTVSNNSTGAAGFGGGLLMQGTSILSDLTISSNSAQHAAGVAQMAGTLDLEDSTVNGNDASNVDGAGGAMVTNATTADLDGVDMDGNTASFAAGVLNMGGTLTIVDGDITDNIASTSGGGVASGIGAPAATALVDTTVSGNSAVDGAGVMQFSGAVAVTDSTISNNNASGNGGGMILTNATVTGTTVLNNTATIGAGILQASGTMSVTSSTVQSNTASNVGSAMIIQGSANVASSVIDNNTATVGGTVFVPAGGSAAISNTEIHTNATGALGAVIAAGTVTIDRSTIALNTGSGGGVQVVGGSTDVSRSTLSSNSGAGVNKSGSAAVTVTDTTITLNGTAGIRSTGATSVSVTNTIIADQAGGAPDCNATTPVTSGGYNLDTDGSCALAGTGDATGAALLAALANNGGSTRTHLPQTGSAALDLGNTASATDQRGVTRPHAGVDDKGSVEVESED